jgi:hypothetical protein
LVKELWSIANIITGFSVVQCLGFALALGKDLSLLQRQEIWFKLLLSILFFVSAGIYISGVWWCYFLATHHGTDAACENIWWQVSLGRSICILFYTAVPIFGLFVPNMFKDLVP